MKYAPIIAAGIDPGSKSGGVAVLDCRDGRPELDRLTVWSPGTRDKRPVVRVWRWHRVFLDLSGLTVEPDGYDPIEGYDSNLPLTICHRLGVEGHPPRMSSRQHGMSLAHVREIGRVIGFMEARGITTHATPEAAEWRGALGIRRGLNAKEADAEVERRIRQIVDLPEMPAWAVISACDAIGVALFVAREE